MADLVVPARFHGPADSGNGGWSAGALAARLVPAEETGPAVSVRLHRPPPLDVPMTVETSAAGLPATAVARLGQDVVMTAARVGPESLPAPLPAVDPETAAATASRYRGARAHPFPTCFTCGPAREDGDGLGLRPGTLLFRDDVTACCWTPGSDLDAGDGVVALPTTWAALDCPGGWALDLVGRPMVLGTIAAAVRRRPRVGEACVVVGAALGESGRTALTATTLYAAGGELLARARQVWVRVDPAAF